MRGGAINPVLVSSPSTHGRYLPPSFLDADRILARVQRDVRSLFRMLIAATALGSLIFYWATDLHGAIMFLVVFGFFCSFVGFDVRMQREDRSTIAERWMFYGWCFSRGPTYALALLAFMLSVGGLQLLGAALLGSDEAYRRAFGLIYQELPHSGEWWRLATAPLLHTSVEHWLSNTMIGVGLMTIYGPVMGNRCVAAIAIAAPAAFATVLVVAWSFSLDTDGVIGISGGIAGMMGCFLTANLREAASFPRLYAVITLFVAGSLLFVVAYFFSVTSFVVHLAGFGFGALFGSLIDPFSPQFHRA